MFTQRHDGVYWFKVQQLILRPELEKRVNTLRICPVMRWSGRETLGLPPRLYRNSESSDQVMVAWLETERNSHATSVKIGMSSGTVPSKRTKKLATK